MSWASQHPNYFSRSGERNKNTVCDCGRRVRHTVIKMDPKDSTRRTCPTCRAESKELDDALDLITS